MSDQIVPDFIPMPPSEPERCPHCGRVLPAGELTIAGAFGVLIALFILAQVVFVLMGVVTYSRRECDQYPETYAGYLAPGFWVGCKLGQPIERER